MESLSAKDYVVLKLRFQEERYPPLLAISSLLYDFELAHDLAVVLSYRQYLAQPITRYFVYRNGRHIEDRHRLRAVAIVKHSPLVLEVAAAIGAVFVLIQILEKIDNWKLNKQKLQMEVALKELEVIEKTEALEKLLEKRRVEDQFLGIAKRLGRSPLQLTDLEIRRPASNDDAEENKTR